jgi:hypothetical protein
MPESNEDFIRVVRFGQNRGGIRLVKNFGPRFNTIQLRSLSGAKVLTSIPETVVDTLITSLLELKVKMKDGSNYNSGFLRLAVVDGSGVESKIEELGQTGRGAVAGMARHLLEEFDGLLEEDEEAEYKTLAGLDMVSELVVVVADDDTLARTINEIESEIGVKQKHNYSFGGRRDVVFYVPDSMVETVGERLSSMPNVYSYNFNDSKPAKEYAL